MTKASIVAFSALIMAPSALVGCRTGSTETDPATAQVSPASPVSGSADETPDKVVVYYFHGNRRCPTCLGIQATVERTVREGFASELASAALTFREVNFEAPEHRHFVREYDLAFSTMVVAAEKGGTTVRWENCNKVWDYAHDEPALAEYT